MSEMDFGIFKDFWDEHPNHLPFLGLHHDQNESAEWNLQKSLDRLDFICLRNDEKVIIEGIHKLLNNENWRLHLLGILASFKISFHQQKQLIPYFWQRLKKGSWVSPQILSVLSMIDHEFDIKARGILKNGFQVSYIPLGMVEHHSARGPEGPEAATEKVISSINSLLNDQNDEFGWKGNLIRLIRNKRFRVNIK